jgi:hypothetical protein
MRPQRLAEEEDTKPVHDISKGYVDVLEKIRACVERSKVGRIWLVILLITRCTSCFVTYTAICLG